MIDERRFVFKRKGPEEATLDDVDNQQHLSLRGVDVSLAPGADLLTSTINAELATNDSEDRFRNMEKCIKTFVRQQCADYSKVSKKHRKRELQKCRGRGLDFDWSEVVDVSTRQGCKRSASAGTAPASDDDGASHVSPACCQLFDLRDVAPGLFLLRGALSVEAQLHWAKRALEVYSLEDHTNLTNLAALQEEIAHGSNSSHDLTRPTSADAAIVSVDAHMSTKAPPSGGECETKAGIDTSEVVMSAPAHAHGRVDEGLWARSCRLRDGFQSFAPLRWSCLGYHYGEDVSFYIFDCNNKDII